MQNIEIRDKIKMYMYMHQSSSCGPRVNSKFFSYLSSIVLASHDIIFVLFKHYHRTKLPLWLAIVLFLKPITEINLISYPAIVIMIVTYIRKKYFGRDINKFSTKGHLANKVQ